MTGVRRCVHFALFMMLSMLPVWGQNYVTGPNTGAESRLDNTPRNVTFLLTVTGSGTYSLAGGIFFMKDGTSTTGNVTLTVFNSAAMALGSVTLSNSQFCSGDPTHCQSYSYRTFMLPSPLALIPGSYTLVLSTNAPPEQNSAYFAKGDGTSFSVMAGGGVGAPNLSISKTSSPSNFAAGMPGAYSVQVTNIGNAPSSGVITVMDTLGANQAFVSASGSGWTCMVASGVTCTTSAVIAAGASAPPITINVNVGMNGESSVTNAVTVAGGGGTNTNNSFTLMTPVSAPNLSILKTSNTATFTQGQNGAYTIQVNNVGNGASSGTITITDALDTNQAFVSASGSGWTCMVASGVTCTTSAVIAAGASAPPITINVKVGMNGESSVTNMGTVSGGGGTNTNNSFRLVTPVIVPSLSVSKTASPFSKGQNGNYTILVSNGGTAPSSGVITVTDTLDTNLTNGMATGMGWSCSTVGQVVTCTTSAVIAAGTSAPPIALSVNVAANAPTTVTNNVTVSGGGSASNSSQLVSAVSATDLTISKTANPATFTQGQNGVVYTITANNIGSAPSSGTITVTDTLGPNLTFVSATGSGWSCSAAGQVVTCTTGAIIPAPGSAPPITLTVNVGANGEISALNTVTIDGGGNVVNTNTSFTLVSTVNNPNLSVSKTASPTTFTQGQSGAYTITANNIGNASSLGTITVTDTLDPNLTFVSATGSSWSCSAAAQVVTCTTSAVIAAGASAPPITINVKVGATAPATVTNNVTVAGGGGTNTNTSFTLVSSVVNGPNLSVSKTANPATFTPGQNGAYTITASNSGNASSSGTVTVTDTLDPNLTFVSATGSGWSCSPAGQVVTCTTSAAIPAGTSAPPITLSVNVSANAQTSVTNNATVAGGGGTNTNNSFQLVTNVGTSTPPQTVPATSTPVLILAGMLLIGMVVWLRRRAAYPG